jgi:hypothetical protein
MRHTIEGLMKTKTVTIIAILLCIPKSNGPGVTGAVGICGVGRMPLKLN